MVRFLVVVTCFLVLVFVLGILLSGLTRARHKLARHQQRREEGDKEILLKEEDNEPPLSKTVQQMEEQTSNKHQKAKSCPI